LQLQTANYKLKTAIQMYILSIFSISQPNLDGIA